MRRQTQSFSFDNGVIEVGFNRFPCFIFHFDDCYEGPVCSGKNSCLLLSSSNKIKVTKVYEKKQNTYSGFKKYKGKKAHIISPR